MAFSSIDKGSSYFNTVLYTGDGSSTRSLTGVGFKPDWVWLKKRNSAASHTLYDIVRTAGSTKGLATNSTAQEGLTATEGTTANFGYVNSFDSDGFSVTAGATSGGYVNISSDTYVAWNWLGANTTASNTSGTITSTVSVNTTSGFSIVSYTGNGTGGATVGHGLGVVPKMIIVKRRNAVAEWMVYHSSVITASSTNKSYLYLNTTDSIQTNGGDTTFRGSTSSTFEIGTDTRLNTNTATYIAYCFAEVKGFSKFGSYTGNGSTDGTFVYTGFKPAFIIIKRTDSANDWYIYDTARSTFNATPKTLSANYSDAEGTIYNNIDILSNGFKCRTGDGATNASGGTYIYMAFASNPFVSSKGLPVTAR